MTNPFWYKKVYVKHNSLLDRFEFADHQHVKHNSKTAKEAKEKIDSFGSKTTKTETISF